MILSSDFTSYFKVTSRREVPDDCSGVREYSKSDVSENASFDRELNQESLFRGTHICSSFRYQPYGLGVLPARRLST